MALSATTRGLFLAGGIAAAVTAVGLVFGERNPQPIEEIVEARANARLQERVLADARHRAQAACTRTYEAYEEWFQRLMKGLSASHVAREASESKVECQFARLGAAFQSCLDMITAYDNATEVIGVWGDASSYAARNEALTFRTEAQGYAAACLKVLGGDDQAG